MRVVITHPDFEAKGGVSNLYKQLQNKFNIPIVHFTVGKRPKEDGRIRRIFRMLLDYWNFVKCINNNNVDIVHLNPSLDLKSFIRDGLFAILAKINKKKIVVFFHGWNKSFEERIERSYVWMFKLFFARCNAFIVLASEFKSRLEKWGIVQPIYQGVSVIDEDELEGFNIKTTLKKRQGFNKYRVLFLSRILKEKGIYEVIEAISLLKTKYPMIELIVAGEGEELENVKSLVNEHNISNVKFAGYVVGREKRLTFEMSHIFCYPTHGDGLPTCVIEAIAFGMPVVTRSVGGLADFFKNEEHGFISDSLDPTVYAKSIERLFLDKELYRKISLHNYQYAQLHFLASKVALMLETIYEGLMNDQHCN